MKKTTAEKLFATITEYFSWKLIVSLLDNKKTFCFVPHVLIVRLIHFLTTVSQYKPVIRGCPKYMVDKNLYLHLQNKKYEVF
jgi:hypothetical protein